MRERTYFIFDETKTVANNWGYCHLWKSQLKIAERLGYKLSNDYGFTVHTDTKKVVFDEKTFENGILQKNCTHNTIKDAEEMLKAWRYLEAKGYTTDYEFIKEVANKKKNK